MTYTYTKITSDCGTESLIRTDENGGVVFIPIDPANSDYQAYLKRDEPQAEQLNGIVDVKAATK